MSTTNEKPTVIVHFHDDGCTWLSDGWKDNSVLMSKAQRAINAGETEADVIKNLEETFEVEVWKTFPEELDPKDLV